MAAVIGPRCSGGPITRCRLGAAAAEREHAPAARDWSAFWTAVVKSAKYCAP